jgi:hypothetical protein
MHGVTIKIMVFTVFPCVWVSVRGPALFRSGVDWRSDGPEDLWFLNGIL